MADRKGRPNQGWYSVSVDTLRGLALLLLILALLVAGYFGYTRWERRALERDAAQVLDETARLFQRLQNEKKLASFRSEYDAAQQSFQAARGEYAARDFGRALEDGKRSRNVLLSIVDALALPDGIGQAQFISVQGDVEFRRGDGGDWEEVRGRQPLRAGDYVRTGNGSAEIVFMDGTLYTVRKNTQFIVSNSHSAPGQPNEQAIQMEYGWVDLNTYQSGSQVKTPGAVARVHQDSEAFVTYDKESNSGRFGALRGGMDLSSKGGTSRQVGELQQVEQTGELLTEAAPLPGRPEPTDPADNIDLDLARQRSLVLAWKPVPGASRYTLQVSRNRLFVDNVIESENRTKTRATLGVRGEGTFAWRVAALGADGLQGPWSTPRQFRVISFRTQGGDGDRTPPKLDLEDVKAYGSIFMVDGRSEPGSRIEVNSEQVKVEADGSFTKAVQLNKEGWSIIEIKAYDAAGNVTARRPRVFVENP